MIKIQQLCYDYRLDIVNMESAIINPLYVAYATNVDFRCKDKVYKAVTCLMHNGLYIDVLDESGQFLDWLQNHVNMMVPYGH